MGDKQTSKYPNKGDTEDLINDFIRFLVALYITCLYIRSMNTTQTIKQQIITAINEQLESEAPYGLHIVSDDPSSPRLSDYYLGVDRAWEDNEMRVDLHEFLSWHSHTAYDYRVRVTGLNDDGIEAVADAIANAITKYNSEEDPSITVDSYTFDDMRQDVWSLSTIVDTMRGDTTKNSLAWVREEFCAELAESACKKYLAE